MTSEDNELPQPYDVRAAIPTAEAIGASADAMEEFNRLLWQIARSVFIIAAMLLAVSFVVMAYFAAAFLITL